MRLENYNKATWSLDRVMLAACFVYPRMGGREWAKAASINNIYNYSLLG